MAAVGNWQMQVDLQEPCSMEYKNEVALATEDAVTVMVYFVNLIDAMVNQIINAASFEEIKARGAIKTILRNQARATCQTDIIKKGHTEDEEVDEHDFLIHG
jgi:hypothetical protein